MPVEELGLDKRIYRQLKRGSLYTVAEIVLAGRLKLRSVRNIGLRYADLVWETVCRHLGLPEDRQSGYASSLEEEWLEAWDAPISVLQLHQQTLHSLKSMGLFWIRDLIKARSIAYSKYLGMRVREIAEIEQALSLYIAKKAQVRLQGFFGPADIPEPEVLEPAAIPDPDLSLPLPKMSERDWSVLEVWAMRLASLEQTVAIFGLRKKELRRIIGQAHQQLRQKLVFLSLFLDHFEKKSDALHKGWGNEALDCNTLILHLLSEPTLPDLQVEEVKVQRLILLMRSMVLLASPWFKENMEQRWPTLILLSCLVEPAIKNHEQVRQILQTRKRGRKNSTNWELAYSVLSQVRTPMHFSAIANRVCRSTGQKPIVAKAMHNSLVSHKEIFVRVGPGTYALAEWGVQAAESYQAIIASLLRQANKPMPPDWIHTRVSAIRPIKFSSLKFCLDLHIRFYKTIENTYGLRSWLLAGELIDSPIPGWLVETPASHKRVERARLKGYDSEKFLAEDRLC